jgi:hypothetical protein
MSQATPLVHLRSATPAPGRQSESRVSLAVARGGAWRPRRAAAREAPGTGYGAEQPRHLALLADTATARHDAEPRSASVDAGAALRASLREADQILATHMARVDRLTLVARRMNASVQDLADALGSFRVTRAGVRAEA